ncbi:MAG: hypothetical protein LBP68_08825, partial [Acidobacteriota bacterium]|nr:hypothetical protein [Acidobacteriota bacterium]
MRLFGINTGAVCRLAAAIAVMVGLTGCGTIKEKAKEAIKAKVEEAQKAREAENAASEAASAEDAEEPGKKPETKKDPQDWMNGDFKVEYDYSPAVGIGTIQQVMPTEHITVVRVGDRVLKRSVAKLDIANVYQVEDGKVYRYMYSPQNMKAVKTEQKNTTIDKGVKSLLSDTLGKRIPAKTKLEKTGTETVGGVACDVYVTVADTKNLDSLKGLAMLGGKDASAALKKITEIEA